MPGAEKKSSPRQQKSDVLANLYNELNELRAQRDVLDARCSKLSAALDRALEVRKVPKRIVELDLQEKDEPEDVIDMISSYFECGGDAALGVDCPEPPTELVVPRRREES